MMRSASVRPVTDRPRKSRTRVAPPACIRSPPKPVTTADGSSFRISVASAPAYRSPDGSPHESITRRGDPTRRLAGLLENARRERDVELDRLDVALDAGQSLAADDGMERDLDAVDAAVIAVALVHAALGRVVLRAIDQPVVAV